MLSDLVGFGAISVYFVSSWSFSINFSQKGKKSMFPPRLSDSLLTVDKFYANQKRNYKAVYALSTKYLMSVGGPCSHVYTKAI